VLLAVMNEPASPPASASEPSAAAPRPSREARLAASQVLRLVARLVPGAGVSRAASALAASAKSAAAGLSVASPHRTTTVAPASAPSPSPRPGASAAFPDLELPSANLAAALSHAGLATGLARAESPPDLLTRRPPLSRRSA
jgi:hypothetical protein